MKLVLLWSDAVVWALVAAALWGAWHVARRPDLRATWKRAVAEPAAMGAAVVLAVFVAVALADSLHFRRALPQAAGAPLAYDPRTESLLDATLGVAIAGREVSYSAPLATRAFAKLAQQVEGRTVVEHPRLLHGGAHLQDDAGRPGDIARRMGLGLLLGAVVAGLAALPLRRLSGREHALPWRAAWFTFTALCLVIGPAAMLAPHYHVLGTDRTGNDVLWQALKSIRTAFVVGSLATVATLPFAIVLGLVAGYLKGWVDELIQYLYTVLSSVPNVLLIAACVLMMQVFIDTHPEAFETSAERADVRLVLLCAILGLTGWATLCRLLRAETLKLRELDYVQAATAFGLGPVGILRRHVFPNVAHLVIITTVLDFSSLVLYEAVLSYVGVGVDPAMASFGGMINLARSEMSRDPVVWWSFTAAFVFMVTLVLAANLFADGVREAFDPRSRVLRARRAVRTRAVP